MKCPPTKAIGLCFCYCILLWKHLLSTCVTIRHQFSSDESGSTQIIWLNFGKNKLTESCKESCRFLDFWIRRLVMRPKIRQVMQHSSIISFPALWPFYMYFRELSPHGAVCLWEYRILVDIHLWQWMSSKNCSAVFGIPLSLTAFMFCRPIWYYLSSTIRTNPYSILAIEGAFFADWARSCSSIFVRNVFKHVWKLLSDIECETKSST